MIELARSVQPQPMRASDPFVDAIAEAVANRLKDAHIRKRLYDIEETAEYLGLSEDAIRDLVSQQKLKALRPTRKLQFDIRDLDALVDQLKKQPR